MYGELNYAKCNYIILFILYTIVITTKFTNFLDKNTTTHNKC